MIRARARRDIAHVALELYHINTTQHTTTTALRFAFLCSVPNRDVSDYPHAGVVE